MEDLCLIFKDKFARFSAVTLSLAFVFLLSTGTAWAQATSAASDANSDLKGSLNNLSNLYQSEVQKLEKQQQQAKGLYDDGLISRVEYEKGEQALTDARAKVEQVSKQ